MFEWSDTDVIMRDTVRGFIDKEIRPHLDALESGELPPYPIARKLFSEFGLDVLPFRRLLSQTRQEARAARSRQAGRAHEFEPGLGGGGFLVGIDKAQHGRGGTRKTQFVGE